MLFLQEENAAKAKKNDHKNDILNHKDQRNQFWTASSKSFSESYIVLYKSHAARRLRLLHGTRKFWHHAANEIFGNHRGQAFCCRLVVGYCSAVTRDGWRWIVDAHSGDGKRYIVHSDELLSAFLELEAMLR